MAESTDKCLISLNPADGSALGFVEATSNKAIHAAVNRAQEALAGWASIPAHQRAKMIEQGAAAMIDKVEALGALLSQETGRPVRTGLREIRSIADGVGRRCSDVIKAIATERHLGQAVESLVRHDPIGVCAVIAPADHPIAMTHRMIIPALVAGNTVILKPAPETPLISQQMVELYQHFLPDGVLQLVQGGQEQGKALVASNVQLVTLTGSTRTGKHIMASAAFGLKRLIMALGGKDVLIVLDGSDLDAAAKYAVESSLGNGGQSCVSTERILVQSSIAGEFEKRITRITQQYRVGTWDDPNADIGPMINADRRQQVINHIRDALSKGAQALCGGEQHPQYFVRPTVLSQVTEEMSIFHNETLGPVLCTIHFDHADDAVKLANRSSYALGAVIFGDETAATAIAHRLDAGMIGINKSVFGVGDIPWVGAKQSGFGYHGSADGYRQFTQARVISRPL
jgi:acyl-CoA reductase-like NAD-dependent aldehyde dehydrogenase